MSIKTLEQNQKLFSKPLYVMLSFFQLFLPMSAMDRARQHEKPVDVCKQEHDSRCLAVRVNIVCARIVHSDIRHNTADCAVFACLSTE